MLNFKNITIGQYIPGQSLIHRLDPRTKIIVGIVFMISLFVISNLYGYIPLCAYLILIATIAHLSPRFILRGLKPIIFIILFTLILNLFWSEGEVLARLGPLKITDKGIRQSALITSRLLLLVVATSLLTLTTSPLSLTDAIERLMNPLKRFGFPAHELAMMMTIALRFIPTLLEETDKIMKAQMARGADFESGNIFKRAKSLIPILVPLFISSFQRANELATAMESRCYRGGEGRTRMKQLNFSKEDHVAGIWTAVIIATAIFISFWR